jgi:hypothetical protein
LTERSAVDPRLFWLWPRRNPEGHAGADHQHSEGLDQAKRASADRRRTEHRANRDQAGEQAGALDAHTLHT